MGAVVASQVEDRKGLGTADEPRREPPTLGTNLPLLDVRAGPADNHGRLSGLLGGFGAFAYGHRHLNPSLAVIATNDPDLFTEEFYR
jgi:hypothetical protein